MELGGSSSGATPKPKRLRINPDEPTSKDWKKMHALEYEQA
jgi:hypothetical protein